MTVLRSFAWLLGVLGSLLCVAGGLGVWYVESRLDSAREHVFERVELSLIRVDRRLVETQELARKLKLSVDEIQERVQSWTKTAASERLVARFDVEERAQQLAAGLRQADALLDLSRETIEHVRDALDMGADLGLSVNANAVDSLLTRIADIQADVGRASEVAQGLAQQIGQGRDEEALGIQAEQVVTLAARLLATFGNIDSRLVAFQDRSADARAAIGQLNTKLHVCIVAAAICATLFLLWMAAGQFCLWRWARNRRG